MKKVTVLEKLLEGGVFADEKEARAWVTMGRVLADEQKVLSVHEKIRPDAVLRVKELYKRNIVSKGAVKLAHALETFGVSPAKRICLDCGASTGGFTDCLLQHGAQTVYAVDVGHGVLAGKLQQDPRVVNLERTNLSEAAEREYPEPVTLVTLDLSYLSLRDAYAHVKRILSHGGEVVMLVKPIFETNDASIRRSGKINEREPLLKVCEDLFSFFIGEGCALHGFTHSPVRGNNGVVEFFLHLSVNGDGKGLSELMEEAERAIETALNLPTFHKEQL